MDDLSNIADPSDPAEPRAPVDPATESPDLLKQAVDQALRAQRAQVVYAARNTTAAQANEQLRTSYLTGLPVATVRAYPDYARLKAERDQFDAMSYTSPLSAAWLTEPGNYAVARDSLDGMAGVEAQVRPSFWSHPIDWAKDLFTSDATDPNKRTVGAGESFGRGFVQAGNEVAVPLALALAGAARVGAYTPQGAIMNWLRPGTTDAQMDAAFQAADYLRGHADDAAINPQAERQDIGGKLGFVGGALANQLPLYLTGEGVASGVGEKMIMAGTTRATRAAGYAVNALERSAAASSLPATASGINTAQRVLDSGHSGGDAALAGFGDFVGQVLTNAAPLGFNKGGRLVRAAQAVPAGIAASAVANEISNATLPDGMQHDADGASLLAGGLLPAIMQMFHAGPVSLRAQQEFVEGQRAQVLAAIEKEADATPLKQQNPSAFENWINRMWPDGTVSASPKDVAALFQSEKTGEGLADLGIDADGWNEAVATGTDVEIPLARYLSRLTPEQRDSLRGSSRFMPSGGFVDAPVVSRSDVEAAIAEVMAADKAGSLGPREDGALGDIYDNIYGQLQPLRGDKEAQVGAQVVQSIYKRVSAMTGIDPAALHDMYRFNLGDGKTPVAQADAQVDPLILAAHSGFRFDEASLYGSSLIPDVIRLGGIRPDSVGAGDLRAADAHLRPGLLNKGGLTAERMAETLAEHYPEWAVRFKDVDSYGRPGPYELVDMIRDELQGNKAYPVPVDQKAQDRLTKRLRFNEYAAAVAQAFEKHNVGASADGSPLAKDLPIERQREIARSAFANPEEFDPALMQGLHDPNEAPSDTEKALGDPEGLYQGKQDQKSSKHPRGQIVFRRADGRLEMNISLLAGADKSTFFHEAAHGFMEMIGDLVQGGKASPELAGYFDTLLKHGNAPGDDAAARAAWWHATDLEGRRDAHEAVAQGFEQYLLTGKAPSPSLRRAFNALKAWMTTLYRSIAGLGKPINAEVRNVFDRLLASEDEINAMRRSFHLDSLLDQAKDLPADVADRVRKLFGDANADADAALTAQLLANERADVRRAMKAERAEMTRQAEAELKDSPVYRAISWLRNGKLPDGTDAPHPMKLDKQALVDERGPEWVQKNLRGMYAEKGGLEPDHAAAVLGFSSGSEMVHAIANTPKLRDAAKAQADARMRALYPDPLTDGKLPDRAAIAAHREKTFRALVAEINTLEGHGRGGMRTHLEVLRAAVKETMARKVLSDVQPHRYRIAEQAAARQAFEAASRQSWDKALEARRRQLLNALLYRAAMDAHARVGKAQKYLVKVNKNKARAKIGKAEGGFLEAQDALLAAIGLRPETDATKATRAALALWLEARHEEGYAIDIPDSVLAGETSKPAKQLTVGQWGDVRDAVKSIRYNADNVNKLRLGKQVRDRKEVDAQVAKAIREGAGKHSRADYRGDPEFRDRLRQVMLEYRASIGAPASLISEMEGFRELGALTEHVMNVIRDANAKLVPLERSEFENSRKLWLEHYSQKEIGALDKPMWIEELGEHWSKRHILNLLQNWGNEGNRKAILSQKSHRLSEADVAALFKRLDARDAKFVQARWDHLEKFAPELDAYHKRMTGLRMKRVEPSPFSFIAKDGTEVSLRGGYFRLHYDPRKSVRGYQVVKDAFDELNSAGTAKAKVSDKQTIERKKSGGLVVDLAIDHFDADIRSTLRVIHMAESVNYVWRALHGSDVRDAFREANKITYHQALTLWLQDVAVGEVVPRNGIDNTLRALRSNIVPMYMAFTILKTPFHYSSLAVTAGRVGMANTLSAIKRYAMSPRKMREYIDSVSPMMGLRETQISETIQRYAQATDGRYKRGRDGMVKAGMFLLVRVWAQVDRISWLAAEAEGLRKFNDVDKARRYADSIVEATQGSSQFIEKSALRRGTLGDKARQSEMVKSLTTMMSFLCARGDLLYRLGYITLGELRNPGFTKAKARAVMNAASSFLMIVTVEGMIYAMSNKGVPTSVQELAQDALDSTAGDTFGSFMGVRDIYAALGGHVQQTPWATLLDNFTKGGQALRAKKFNDVAVRKAAISTAGSLTGFPSSQVNKTLSALDEVRAGRKIELTELLTGHKKKKN